MEKICISNCKIVFFLYLLFHFSLGSSDYTPPNKYFINCGSHDSFRANKNSRVFIGDENPDRSSFSFSPSSHLQETGSSTDTPDLYKTARVFKVQSCYELQIEQNGNYMVRLHFYPFSSMDNLSLARFNVSTSTVLLLSQSNFSLLNTSNSPLIEEFILTINVGKFRFYFTPFDESSFAFVNAIEAFLVPPALFPNSIGLFSRGLRVIHRIKVGGVAVKPDDDKLWRNWLPDDPYLLTKNATQERSYAEDGLKDQAGNGTATEYTAPYGVYKSARVSETTSIFVNITWSFEVSKNAKHFVRAHFCDVASQAENIIMEFSLYIYDFNKTVNLQQVGVPFYEDLLVDSDNSGFMNISISPRDTYMPAAFLNGLEIMQFMTNLSSPIIYCSLASGESGKKHLFVIIGSVVGVVAFIIILMVVLFFTLKCRKTKLLHETSEWPLTPLYAGSSHTRISELTGNVSLDSLHLGLKAPFHEILRATNNFDSKLMIGEGGFGKVYKGTLWNGMKVAVKRSEPGCGQGRPEFQTEIMILSRIRHRHLVSIYGYCDENSEMILVYEFMEKGTLRDHLYNSNKDSKDTSSLAELSWSQRLEICIGAAKGLNYLHTGSDDAIIHRDVKSTNILLDQNFVAKVADFGLSRSGPLDQYISTEVKGTFGYLDPEYFSGLQLTQKSDVYSFGVVLLEVLCARPAINNTLPREQVNLAEWGVFCQKERQLDKIIDPSLVGQINPNSLRKFGEIMEKCLKQHGIDRPNMIDVMWDLEYALQLQHSVARRDHDEDSTNVSWQLSLPVSSPLPFDSASINTEEMYLKAHDELDMSNISAGEEFSQLKTNDAR